MILCRIWCEGGSWRQKVGHQIFMVEPEGLVIAANEGLLDEIEL